MPKRTDKTILVTMLILIAFGFIMIYSASAVISYKKYGDSFFFLKKQLIWGLLGMIAFMAAHSLDYRTWQRYVIPVFALSCLMLILVLTPLFGPAVNGSRRWLRLGIISFQPSEITKLAVIIYLAGYLARKGDGIRDFFHGFVPPMILIGIIMGLIIIEPDLGSVVTIGLVAGTLLLIGGARLSHMSLVVLLSAPIVYRFVMQVGYRRQRWETFLNPWMDPAGSGFQIVQSFMAFGSGGLLGSGLGEGRQKLFFLPYPHTDFIFAIIGEEMGLLGVFSIILLYLLLALKGCTIAIKTEDLFGSYLAFGITMMITIQVLINICVATGLLPTKGLALPFLSYGGSSLLTNMLGMGMLSSIAKDGRGR
ncbi:MAG: putative lipid II flippase FtsW [Nitrospirae bacterium]|nr:putative lipid II flippase FtsW [Nitrospirota bacterium]